MVEVIVAVIGCFGAILVEMLRNARKLSKIEDRISSLEKYNQKTYMNSLKAIIASPEMPYDERIIAGREYIDHKGNGAIKKIYNELVKRG